MDIETKIENMSDLSPELFKYRESYLPITELELFVTGYLKEEMSEKDKACDAGTVYTLNSEFFRSPEFGQVDLIALGCSQTFGQGVDDHVIWPRLLGESMGVSYVNLGMPSSSVHAMLSSLLVYIRRYGKPKYVAALLPGYRRIAMPLRHEYNSSAATSREQRESGVVGYENLNLAYREQDGAKKDVPLYSKRPYIMDDILAYEVPLHQSMTALSVMIEYCRVADIKLVFSSWNSGMDELLREKLNNPMTEIDLSGYISMPTNRMLKSCHEEQSALYQDIWDRARDCGHHMGAHEHIHYAELFEESLKKNG